MPRLAKDRTMHAVQPIQPADTVRSLAASRRVSEPKAIERPNLERARGDAQIAVESEDGRTRLCTFFQSGSAKIRLPRVRPDAPLEAIFLNTAGGVTGGDHLLYSAKIGEGARAVIASQAAERVYRRSGGTARIDTRLEVAAKAHLHWLPQETILFDRSSLSRTLSADLDATATLLAVEAIVLGRAAMGEEARSVTASDSWRIRRAGRLVFADTLRLDGDTVAIMAGGATGNGARALATVLLVAPDAEARIDMARGALVGSAGEAGVSAWNGMLVARLIAPGGQALRADLMRLIEILRGASMPRVWQC
jgi:urease accessory protein